MSLSIIIPCRNEEENIKTTVDNISNYLEGKIQDFEINLINDFSNDKTLEKAKNISQKKLAVNVYNNMKIGLGGAINLGIEKSAKKYCVIVMADLSDSPEDILKYYSEINEKNLDAVFGSRFTSSSKVINYPKKKLILNRIFNNIVKIIFWKNYNDYTNAFKIYRTDVLKKMRPIVSENFNIFLEIPLKIIIRKYKFTVVPINWQNRKSGTAKFKVKELGSKYLFTLLYCLFEKVLLR